MMKSTLIFAAVTSAAVSFASLAQAQPADDVAGPAPTRVLVVPFAALNVPDSQQWISQGVQENMVADFGRPLPPPGPAATFSPIALQAQVIVEDNATAARLARQAHAPLAIRGAAQMVGEQIRLTAQLIDAQSGDTLSTASVTGPLGNLLKMEDDLAAQLRGVPTAPAPGVAGGPLPGAPAPTVVPTVPVVQPQVIIITQPPATNYPIYPDYAAYSGYNYPFVYGGFISPIIISNDHHRHHPGNNGEGFHVIHSGPSSGPLTISTPPGGIVPLSPQGGITPLSTPGGITPLSPRGGMVPLTPAGGITPQAPQFISTPRSAGSGAGNSHNRSGQ